MESEKLYPTEFADIVDDPKKYGMPTFQEFAKNPDAYRLSDDFMLGVIDAGDKNLKEVKRHIYKVFGYKTKSLAEAERIARNHGYSITSMKCKPEVRQDHSTKLYIEVSFEP